MRRVNVLVVVTVVTVSVGLATVAGAQVAPNDWPQFGRVATHRGANFPEQAFTPQNVQTMHTSWQGVLGSFVDSSSSPVVANGFVYVGASDGNLSVFSTQGCGSADSTCQPFWQGHTNNGIYGAPAVDGETVFVASADRFLYAFPASGCNFQPTCAPLWRGRLHMPSLASVAINGNTVYASGYNGAIIVFSTHGCGAAICEPRWTGTAIGHSASSPAVGSALVFFDVYTANRSWLYAFPAAGCGATTCAPAWRASLGGQSFATPSVADGRVYTATAEGPLDAFAAAGCGQLNCTPLWQYDTLSTFLTGAPAFNGDTMYVSSEGSPDPNSVGVVQAFAAAGCGKTLCKPRWTGINFGFGFESSPAIAGGVVFVAKGPASGVPVDAGVYAYDAHGCGHPTCAPLDFAQVGVAQNYLGSSIAVGEGKIFFESDDNTASLTKLYALNP